MEKILFEYKDIDGQYTIESTWAERVDNYYKLENVLFYASNYAFGDIV